MSLADYYLIRLSADRPIANIIPNKTKAFNWLKADLSIDASIERDQIESLMVTRYLIDISQYILLPIYSFIRLFLYSFDVIHTLGFYSWGIKIDAIPGRINLTTTLRLLWKGEYRGKCFELCGQGHLSMLITTLVAFLSFIYYCFS